MPPLKCRFVVFGINIKETVRISQFESAFKIHKKSLSLMLCLGTRSLFGEEMKKNIFDIKTVI